METVPNDDAISLELAAIVGPLSATDRCSRLKVIR
jgi:hypothetical protein